MGWSVREELNQQGPGGNPMVREGDWEEDPVKEPEMGWSDREKGNQEGS